MGQLTLYLPPKHLLVPVAIPGSGKTTLLETAAASMGDPSWRFGADDVRRLAFGNVSIQGNPGLVHSAARSFVSVRLAAGLGAAYDSTSVGGSDRQALLALAAQFDTPVYALLSQVPFEVARVRNVGRPEGAGQVPEFVMDKMVGRARGVTAAGLLAEGFREVFCFDEHTTEILVEAAGAVAA